MDPEVVLLTTDVPSLENLCITAWLIAANRCLVGNKHDSLHAVQDILAGLLRDSLGGVSSKNIRSKMMERMVDARFLIALSKQHSVTTSSVNKVGQRYILSFNCTLFSSPHSLNFNCRF